MEREQRQEVHHAGVSQGVREEESKDLEEEVPLGWSRRKTSRREGRQP